MCLSPAPVFFRGCVRVCCNSIRNWVGHQGEQCVLVDVPMTDLVGAEKGHTAGQHHKHHRPCRPHINRNTCVHQEIKSQEQYVSEQVKMVPELPSYVTYDMP